MKISVFGTGYVGLVTGTCLSELGNEVTCCDIDENKITSLKNGQIPFFEPGLQEVASRNITSGRLKFTTNKEQAILGQNIIFIAVGTPPSSNGSADISAVEAVAKSIGDLLNEDNVIIVTKSTVPLGTSLLVKNIINEGLKNRSKHFIFDVVSNPEFLRQGRAVEDFMVPDRIVVGTNETWVKPIIENLYAPLTKNGHPIFSLFRNE